MEYASICQYFQIVQQLSMEETTFSSYAWLYPTIYFHDPVKEVMQRCMESSAMTRLLASCWRES